MAEHITQREAQSNATQLDNVKNREKEGRFLFSQVLGAGGGGFASGYLAAKNPTLNNLFGRGVKLDHIIAGVGFYLGRKRGKYAAIARGASLGAIYHLTHAMGTSQGADSLASGV